MMGGNASCVDSGQLGYVNGLEQWMLLGGGLGLVVLCLITYSAGMPFSITWDNENQNRLRRKRQQREKHFQDVEENLKKLAYSNKKRQYISSLSFFELQEQLQTGRITASESVDAFRWKSLQCQQKYNCIVEFITEAPELAQRLDKEYSPAVMGKEKAPLYGIPFSVKENIHLAGYESTAGLSKWIGHRATHDNSLVEHMKNLGAIPIVRTNIPQTCVSFTCSNCLFGTTLNPHDVTRTPGGSSGGEGCLISAGGCPFGVGSDIGGSLRIPAHFCGITTLKPTSSRPKVNGGFPGIPGVKELALSYGFFTKDVSSLLYLFQLTLVPSYFRNVPKCVPVPFNNDYITSEMAPLRIGYYLQDGWFPSVPSCKRAVVEARDILVSLGHELVPVEIPKPDKVFPLMMKCLFIDNGAYFVHLFQHEQVDTNLKLSKYLASLPLWFRWLASRLVASFDPKSSLAIDSYVRNLEDMRGTLEGVDLYLAEFLDYWKSLNLDSVIGTVLPFPALPHDGPMKLSHAVFGTMLYNLLDLPAGVVPVTNVRKLDELEMKGYPDCDEGWYHNPIYSMVRDAMKGSEGLPVGVQVITLPYQEELCLKIMRDIEAGVRKY